MSVVKLDDLSSSASCRGLVVQILAELMQPMRSVPLAALIAQKGESQP